MTISWREQVQIQIDELEKLINVTNRQISKLSSAFESNSINKNDINKLNELASQKAQYEFARNEFYRLLGTVKD